MACLRRAEPDRTGLTGRVPFLGGKNRPASPAEGRGIEQNHDARRLEGPRHHPQRRGGGQHRRWPPGLWRHAVRRFGRPRRPRPEGARASRWSSIPSCSWTSPRATRCPTRGPAIPASRSIRGGDGSPAIPAPGQPGTVDKTGAATGQIAGFFGSVTRSQISVSVNGSTNAVTTSYSGPSEWSFRRFILHYAKLCDAINAIEPNAIDGFIIGSELRGLCRSATAARISRRSTG